MAMGHCTFQNSLRLLPIAVDLAIRSARDTNLMQLTLLIPRALISDLPANEKAHAAARVPKSKECLPRFALVLGPEETLCSDDASV